MSQTLTCPWLWTLPLLPSCVSPQVSSHRLSPSIPSPLPGTPSAPTSSGCSGLPLGFPSSASYLWLLFTILKILYSLLWLKTTFSPLLLQYRVHIFGLEFMVLQREWPQGLASILGFLSHLLLYFFWLHDFPLHFGLSLFFPVGMAFSISFCWNPTLP